MIEELYNKAIKNYMSYLDLTWDLYYTKETGILPIRL